MKHLVFSFLALFSVEAVAGRTAYLPMSFDHYFHFPSNTVSIGHHAYALFSISITNISTTRQTGRVVLECLSCAHSVNNPAPNFFIGTSDGITDVPLVGQRGTSFHEFALNPGASVSKKLKVFAQSNAASASQQGIRFLGGVSLRIQTTEDRGALVASVSESADYFAPPGATGGYDQNMPIGMVRHLMPATYAFNGGRAF